VARARAAMLDDDTWQDAFKRGILLADAKITPVERRANVTRLDTLPQIPVRCARYISSGATGRHYSFSCLRALPLQQAAAVQRCELDTLRQQQQHLRTQLDTTTRKLENLTDIERQLVAQISAGPLHRTAIRRNKRM
jgi:hypothetical protein